MKKKKEQNQKGITLIALVITIILLIILAAIVIRSLAGSDGLVETTLTAKEEHTIAEYRSALEEIVEKEIMTSNVKGKDATRKQIADKINEQDWVREANPDEESKSIIVITHEGYIF